LRVSRSWETTVQSAHYERLVRRLRQRIFGYTGEKSEQASRVLVKMLARIPKTPEPVDQWGARPSDRRMLARHGICWGD